MHGSCLRGSINRATWKQGLAKTIMTSLAKISEAYGILLVATTNNDNCSHHPIATILPFTN
jgi:hypothetical protein